MRSSRRAAYPGDDEHEHHEQVGEGQLTAIHPGLVPLLPFTASPPGHQRGPAWSPPSSSGECCLAGDADNLAAGDVGVAFDDHLPARFAAQAVEGVRPGVTLWVKASPTDRSLSCGASMTWVMRGSATLAGTWEASTPLRR